MKNVNTKVLSFVNDAREAIERAYRDPLTSGAPYEQQEALLALCAAIEELERVRALEVPKPDNWVAIPHGCSTEMLNEGVQYEREMDDRRWVAKKTKGGFVPPLGVACLDGPEFEDGTELMSVKEHERLMELLRFVVRDNDEVFRRVRQERNDLLDILQRLQKVMWPTDTVTVGTEKAPIEDKAILNAFVEEAERLKNDSELLAALKDGIAKAGL